jgi:hypothetical protein
MDKDGPKGTAFPEPHHILNIHEGIVRFLGNLPMRFGLGGHCKLLKIK